jgi:hypothetical protein
MATLMTMNVKERRERIPVVEKQGDLIKHRDLWKQSDLVDSPEIKLGNSIDPNQIHEALHPQTVQKVEAKEGNTNDNQNQTKTKVITFEPPTTLFVFEKVTVC